MEQWLAKVNKLSKWQVAIIITVIGFAVFFTGLKSPFMDDDQAQIVDNPVVHSITHVKLLFEGGTFYSGSGIAPLNGDYFRPLMSVAFSLLYTLFGPNTVSFHLLQLLLCIFNAVLLYLLFERFFNTILSFTLALIFLVHPINSQVAFAIPTLQDALFFFFGMLAILSLLKFNTVRSLLVVAACLFLSLLSKEAGAYFVIMAFLYLILFDRKRLYPFLGIIALPAALYLTLKISAVGLNARPYIAPIDSLNLSGRLLTAPSIISFYITKLIFPWRLASRYYWMYRTFDFRHVLLPLIVDLIVVALFVYLAFEVRKRLPKTLFCAYLLFATWAAVGLIPYLQIAPLDMTASENWFYFPTVGVLGMIGLALVAFQAYIRPSWFVVIVALVIGALGLRTAIRGTEWSSLYNHASHNIQASREDWVAYADLAHAVGTQGDFSQAKVYELRSLEIYPNGPSYSDLGLILANLGDYRGAMNAYNASLKYANLSFSNFVQPVITYENVGQLMLVYGNPDTNKKFAADSVRRYPWDMKLWLFLALLDEKRGDNAAARMDISAATRYGNIPQYVVDRITNHQPLTVNLSSIGKTVTIQ